MNTNVEYNNYALCLKRNEHLIVMCTYLNPWPAPQQTITLSHPWSEQSSTISMIIFSFVFSNFVCSSRFFHTLESTLRKIWIKKPHINWPCFSNCFLKMLTAKTLYQLLFSNTVTFCTFTGCWSYNVHKDMFIHNDTRSPFYCWWLLWSRMG
jgi:hypothetical protein